MTPKEAHKVLLDHNFRLTDEQLRELTGWSYIELHREHFIRGKTLEHRAYGPIVRLPQELLSEALENKGVTLIMFMDARYGYWIQTEVLRKLLTESLRKLLDNIQTRAHNNNTL